MIQTSWSAPCSWPGRRGSSSSSPPRAHQIVYHVEQLSELRAVCARPRLKIPTEVVAELIENIERYGQRVDCDLDAKLDYREPKDDYVLAVALAGQAECILTEDDDLLVLNPWRSIQIARLFKFLQEHPLPTERA